MHRKELNEVFESLHTSEQGLTTDEAQRRLKEYGPNKLREAKKTRPLTIFLRQFHSLVIYILLGATAISAFLGYRDYLKEGGSMWSHQIDAIVIFAIVILNSILGFVQEYKAEKAIEHLRKLTALQATVLRDGQKTRIDATQIVPGDIIFLEEGDKVPADSRLYEVINLETMEASLTGESNPVSKNITVVPKETPVAEQHNMAFASTIVTRGRGSSIVVGTGMRTQIGKIAQLIRETPDESTPLQRKLQRLGKWLGTLTILICLIVFATGVLRTGDYIGMFITAVALAVAAVPEGLPAIVTISLALGSQRMIKRNALVRKLSSVETLGACTVICSDKTGTLTHNQMTVQKLYVNNEVVTVAGEGYKTEGEFSSDPKKFKLLLQIGALCNNSTLKGDSEIIGDPTEAAMLVTAAKAGMTKDKLNDTFPRINELPFDSKRKRMSTLHKVDNNFMLCTKGAPDVILDHCTKIYINGRVRRLMDKDKKKILQVNEKFAKEALRVLGCAVKLVKNKKEANEENLTFVGLQAMLDPPRAEVKDAIVKCKQAGIKAVMITGDHQVTAEAIGKKLGLTGKVVTGPELDAISHLELEVENIAIYARVTPEHKLKIIDALKERGHIVAMTGDGVNDAPALKKADIGVGMGIAGTDVAKEASDMVLTDDNFASIVNAIEEGRSIYNNIKKFVNYLLSCNVGEVLLIFIAMLIGFKTEAGILILPLLAIQILWVNLVTDGLPAVALGVDPSSPGLMQQLPRKPTEHIITANMSWNIFSMGLFIALAALGLFIFGLEGTGVRAQTLAFTSLVVFELVRVQMVRRQYKLGLFTNKWLLGAIALSLLLQILVVYTPLQVLFKTTALGVFDWLAILAATVSLYILGTVFSIIIRKLTKEVD